MKQIVCQEGNYIFFNAKEMPCHKNKVNPTPPQKHFLINKLRFHFFFLTHKNMNQGHSQFDNTLTPCQARKICLCVCLWEKKKKVLTA